ncbi:MAG: 50S ribosomal protein L25 [Planctomycetes bacterium]|nr:50S ribosomal protein L25 [Planctomycetota bacterium]
MEVETLKADTRPDAGTRSARKLRESGRIPAIIYGHGEAPQSVSLALHDVKVALAQGARTLRVSVAGSTEQFFIKAVQYDHLDMVPIHMDLARVSKDERVKVRVGIELRGIAKGISEGGILDQHLADIEVECGVMEIPGTFHPLVTELDIGDSLYVKDIELPSGVVAITGADERVATVRAAEKEAEPDEDAAETEEGEAEPERIGRVRKDDEEKKGDAKKS